MLLDWIGKRPSSAIQSTVGEEMRNARGKIGTTGLPDILIPPRTVTSSAHFPAPHCKQHRKKGYVDAG
jgi:hypothetical protein